ncbi:MAG: preprotein translocase subunit SecG [Desulfobulbaceae bacterium]|nr:preprotein translocase subunit SecG [Desulfobulbaceae bacterium]HIJ79436.1 preprotein translocase subunit SecG [Deltaproteobacteria bacterium]
MDTLLTVIHITVCLFLVVIVLLQQGKGADMGAAFGGSSQTVFGSDGPLPLLNKITTGAAVLFMLTSISLAYLSTNRGDGSVMKDLSVIEEQAAPKIESIPLPSAATDVPMEKSDAVPAKTE